jgi:hypothetical protein
MAPDPGAPRARIVLVNEGRDVPFGAVDADAACDLALVDELCRLRLAARRQGLVVRLVDVDDELRDWLTFVGVAELAGVQPAGARRATPRSAPGDRTP